MRSVTKIHTSVWRAWALGLLIVALGFIATCKGVTSHRRTAPLAISSSTTESPHPSEVSATQRPAEAPPAIAFAQNTSEHAGAPGSGVEPSDIQALELQKQPAHLDRTNDSAQAHIAFASCRTIVQQGNTLMTGYGPARTGHECSLLYAQTPGLIWVML